MASEEEFAYSAGELDDEEGDDVDWEDVGSSQHASEPAVIQEPASNSSPETQESAPSTYLPVDEDPPNSADPAPSLQEIDWEQVNQSLAEQDAASSARKRRQPPIRLSKDEKQREKALHQTHLLVLLAARVKWSKLSRPIVVPHGDK